jgi:PAS domain S-box-containing protein
MTNEQFLTQLIRLRRRVRDLEERALGAGPPPGGPETRAPSAAAGPLFEHAINGIATFQVLEDERGRPRDFVFLDVNPAFESLTGLSPDRVRGRSAPEMLPPVRGLEGGWRNFLADASRSAEPLQVELYCESFRGWLSVSARRLRQGSLVASFSDITERVTAEEALRESEERFRSIYDRSPLGVELYDREGWLLYANRASLDIFGVREPFEMRRVKLFDDPHIPAKAKGKLLEGKKVSFTVPFDLEREKKERQVRSRKSGVLYVEMHIAPLGPDLRDYGYLMQLQDVTARKLKEEEQARARDELERIVGERTRELSEANKRLRAEMSGREQVEARLRESVREKEILLKEVYHRVKNNLLMISSLLRLQSAQLKDREARDLFRESRDRVRSMSLIHEKLYQSADMASIDLRDYIRNLAVYLFRSYSTDASNVNLVIDVPPVSLDVDTIIPCGLILNELISNALKHAFPEGRTGEVRISLRQEDENSYELLVRDTGAGLPAGLDVRRTETLGMQLVCSLAEQLGGRLEVQSDGGTSFRITFREKASPASS